jgi:LPS O-antigen subunit length determinant protein (WzzB/FepE family)
MNKTASRDDSEIIVSLGDMLRSIVRGKLTIFCCLLLSIFISIIITSNYKQSYTTKVRLTQPSLKDKIAIQMFLNRVKATNLDSKFLYKDFKQKLQSKPLLDTFLKNQDLFSKGSYSVSLSRVFNEDVVSLISTEKTVSSVLVRFLHYLNSIQIKELKKILKIQLKSQIDSEKRMIEHLRTANKKLYQERYKKVLLDTANLKSINTTDIKFQTVSFNEDEVKNNFKIQSNKITVWIAILLLGTLIGILIVLFRSFIKKSL